MGSGPKEAKKVVTQVPTQPSTAKKQQASSALSSTPASVAAATKNAEMFKNA